MQDASAAFMALSHGGAGTLRGFHSRTGHSRGGAQHTVYFFYSLVSFVNLLLCPLSLTLKSCFLLFMLLPCPYLSICHSASPSLFLYSVVA